MRKLTLTLLVLCLALAGRCQSDSLAGILKEGVELHDKGDYVGAIAKYDAILAVDSRYFPVYIEKTFTLYTAGRYPECVDLCRKALKEFHDEDGLKNIYVKYGSALDGLGKPDEAIKIYKEGIKKFPNVYLLPFNKAITEYSQKQYDDAVKDCEAALTLNRGHASSHQYLAYAIYRKNRMAAALALTGFLLLEPRGKRAEKNLPILLKVLGANVEKKDEKTINITMPSSALGKEKGEDDFRITEMTMSFATAAGMGSTAKEKDTTVVGQLRDKLHILAVASPGKKGFFTNTYVNLLDGLDKAGLLETAAHVIYQTARDADNQQWLMDHAEKVQEFMKWMNDWVGARP